MHVNDNLVNLSIEEIAAKRGQERPTQLLNPPSKPSIQPVAASASTLVQLTSQGIGFHMPAKAQLTESSAACVEGTIAPQVRQMNIWSSAVVAALKLSPETWE